MFPTTSFSEEVSDELSELDDCFNNERVDVKHLEDILTGASLLHVMAGVVQLSSTNVRACNLELPNVLVHPF